jgi:hypothetical protein
MPHMKLPSDQHRIREIFSQSGLTYGRSFGSKSGYLRANPVQFYVANACVLSRDGRCLWRGDLDLADLYDREALVRASRRLALKLFIFRQEVEKESSFLPHSWLARNAVATVWQGNVETAGSTRALRGTVDNIVERLAPASRRGRSSRRVSRKRILVPEHEAMMAVKAGDHIQAALDETRREF